MIDLVIVGAGGHGREMAAAVVAINRREPTWNLVGFVDDGHVDQDRLDRLGLTVLGGIGILEGAPSTYALGIGDATTRRRIAQQLDVWGCAPATIVAATASIGLDVRLAPGAVVYEHATLTTNVTVGAHSHVNVGCAIQHDSVVGDFVQMSPGVFVNGDCVIDDDVFLGTGAIVTRGCRIGAGAIVGAGATVLDDVAPGTTVFGTPARPH